MVAQPNTSDNVLGTYSAAQLARIAGVSPGLVRRYALAGILGESGAGRFGFTDVVLLKAITNLRQARISFPRIRRALEGLREQLPPEVPVSAASVAAEGKRIVARFGEHAWDLESGQRMLDLNRPHADFESTELAPVADRVEQWFEWAVAAEAEDPEEAARLYRRVLSLDRDHPEAHLNLGRLLHERDDLYLAERHYRRAIAVRESDPTAWFNLGVVLEDRGRKRPAVDAYRRATELDDSYADAYYNLGNLLQEQGESGEAVRCLKRYRELSS